MRFVDAHCHLDRYPDPKVVADACEEAQTYTIAVTNLPVAFAATDREARGRKFVRAAAGLHPELVSQHPDAIEHLLPLMARTGYVGEVGLDYTQADAPSRQLQRRVFERVLAHCESLGGKVITVHSRRAADDVVDVVQSVERSTIILHWFSGSQKAARRAIDAGCFFSVNPAMTRSASGRAIIAMIPDHRLLTETDGPFVKHAGRVAHPFEMSSFLPAIAKARGTTTSAVQAIILRNFRDAVRLNAIP